MATFKTYTPSFELDPDQGAYTWRGLMGLLITHDISTSVRELGDGRVVPADWDCVSEPQVLAQAQAEVETDEETTTRWYRLTATSTEVSVFDGNLESDVEVPGADVTITDGIDTWTGTVTSPDGAQDLDEWLSGTVRELALRHGRHITDDLREAVSEAAKGRSYSATIEIL